MFRLGSHEHDMSYDEYTSCSFLYHISRAAAAHTELRLRLEGLRLAIIQLPLFVRPPALLRYRCGLDVCIAPLGGVGKSTKLLEDFMHWNLRWFKIMEGASGGSLSEEEAQQPY